MAISHHEAKAASTKRTVGSSPAVDSTPANDDREPAVVTAKHPKPVPAIAPSARPSAIVTAGKPGKRYVLDAPLRAFLSWFLRVECERSRATTAAAAVLAE
jgi:hypothetical protein